MPKLSSDGYLCEIDGSQAEIRYAGIHTICSRAILSRKYNRKGFDLAFHRSHRDKYLIEAADNKIIQAFASGRDIHTEVAAMMEDKPFDQIVKEERKNAKFVSLGRIYRRGYKAIAGQYGLDEMVVKEKIEKWDASFPEFGIWHDAATEYVCKHGYMVSMFDLIRRLPDVFGQEEEWVAKAIREAINSPVQGDSHLHISKASGWFQEHYLDKDRNLRSVFNNDIHDAYLVDTPAQELDKTAIMMGVSMVRPYFEPDEYPFMVCDLASELDVHTSWGNPLFTIAFDTAKMKDKHHPNFNLYEECARVYFEAKESYLAAA